MIRNIFLLSLVCLTGSCQKEETNYDTKTYDDYASFNLPTLDEFYSYEGTYCIELYHLYCPYCTSIKEDLFRYLDKYSEGKASTRVFIYNMDVSTTSQGIINRAKFKKTTVGYQDSEPLIEEMKENKVNTIGETYFFAVPSLYIIENNVFKDLLIGSTDIANYYSSLK